MKNIDYVIMKYYSNNQLSKSQIIDLFCPREFGEELSELNCANYECDCTDCWNLEMSNEM